MPANYYDPAHSYLDFVTEEVVSGATATAANLKELTRLAELQYEYELEVASIQMSLKAAQDRLSRVSETLLPECMDSVGMEEFKTTSGLIIKVERNMRAQISKDRKESALGWLTEHGHGGLIKRKVVATFGRAESERATGLMDIAREAGYGMEYDESVHPQTLQAWVREMLSAGADVPLELFGVYEQRLSRVKSI